MHSKLRLGISACLLGQKVRYDGGHRRDPFLTGTWGPLVDFAPVCPESECGLGTPRETMRLVGTPTAPRLVTWRSRQDHTERLMAWANRRVADLAGEDLTGFIFKSGSPSCGPETVKVYHTPGPPVSQGAGLFARIFIGHFPLLPVIDEKRLEDPARRENFLARVFTLRRWRETLAWGHSRDGLLDFHTRHRLLLRSHSPEHCRRMEQLTAQVGELAPAEALRRYQTLLTAALGRMSTVKKHAATLERLTGLLQKRLTAPEREELLEIIATYRQGAVPWIVPQTLINHFVRRYEVASLKNQYYLQPHPLELLLRCHT